MSVKKSFIYLNAVKGLILSAAAALLGIVVSFMPLFADLTELIDLKLLFTLRGAKPPPAETVVIAINKGAADRMALSADPKLWGRKIHAELTEKLTAAGAKGIAFDLFFDEPTDDDRILAEAFKDSGRVAVSQKLSRETASLDERSASVVVEISTPPAEPLHSNVLASAPFPLPKIPVRLNQCWNFISSSGDMPSMPAAAVQIYWIDHLPQFLSLVSEFAPKYKLIPNVEKSALSRDPDFINLMRGIRNEFASNVELESKIFKRIDALQSEESIKNILKRMVSFYASEETIINYYGPPRTIRTIDYDEALKGSPDVKGKLVFVGFSENILTNQKDVFYTVFSNSEGVDIPGIEVGATIAANAINGEFITPLSPTVFILILLVSAVFAGFSGAFLKPSAAVGVHLLLCLSIILLSWLVFSTGNIWMPITPLVLLQIPFVMIASFIWRFVEAKRERQSVKDAFSHYIPSDMVEKLSNDISLIQEAQSEVYGVCLYTDAEHYTSISERLRADELATFMNRYFETIFSPIRKHGGTISNIVGDSALAFWLESQYPDNSKKLACLAAAEISDEIDKFNKLPSNDFTLPIRIGIHAGNIVLGNFGGSGHYEYRPVGDIVNTATRLEGLNKMLGTTVIVSEEVAKGCNEIPFRHLGKFLFVGKSIAVSVFEPWQKDLPELSLALEEFRNGNFMQASIIFKSDQLKEIPVSRFYLELCSNYEVNKPKDWNGTVRLTSK